ncbi:L-ascorbate metabolism protein UlaG (beta-lactamase superfamily) [Desulfitobacterium sp. LBE]|uniref:Metallo-beta-lactamase domain-containing protein n=1 Tax=bioreactor metagenome TaxID=1076179 RepID=A0A644TA78_9ZZZZ|nr:MULTISPECIES: MBL fold metallo-hydrolase [Desulfitobacterium]MEA5024342.1 MBL fold metallo-hydrolase [Desulfitobacterium hafniense]TWH58306.1 L-ascorbate metabolism protein UlaG (beta-lactamase superfamily) [Desulfitobacterium sp. LBE]
METSKTGISRRKFITLGIAAVGGLALASHVGYNNDTDNTEKMKKPTQIPTPAKWKNEELTVAWLGHAGFLINFYGTKILIDPAFYERIGLTPLGNYTIGMKRYVACPLTAEQAGKVDLVICSHAHTDHFDYPSLRSMQSPDTAVVTAKGTRSLWEGLNYKTIDEMHWGDEKEYPGGLKVKAIEGEHWGARLPWNKEMEANSILLSKNGVNLFIGADTGYTEKFQQQLREVEIELAIMGIAAYSPKSFEARHATPEQAIQMAEEMGAKKILPMHWGTFKLSQEPMEEPIQRFNQAMAGKMEKIALQEIGATWVQS